MTTAVETQPKPALWEDFVDIFTSPASVFSRRAKGAGWGWALLVVVVVMGVLFLASQNVLAPIFDAEFDRAIARAMEQNPEMDAASMEAGRAMARTFGVVGFTLMLPVGILLLGVVTWAVGKAFGATLPLKAAFMVATYAQFPRILEQVLSLAQGFVLDPASLDSRYAVTLGAARFLDPDATNAVALALAGRFDVFVLWVSALLGIGLFAAGRLPKSQAALAAAVLWVVGAVPQLLSAIMQG